jgi:hypothetical protein
VVVGGATGTATLALAAEATPTAAASIACPFWESHALPTIGAHAIAASAMSSIRFGLRIGEA